MRWRGERESDNIEDRRGEGGGGGGGGRRIGGGLGAIVLALIAMYFGVDPGVVTGILGGGPAPVAQAPAPRPAGAARGGSEDELARFVSVVLASTEDVWRNQFSTAGRRYEDPKLVLFSGAVQSACGRASTSVGPFYCPGDHKVYIDLAFYQELQQRFGAPGDTAQAYVIAHEVGHHVQNLMGILPKVQEARDHMNATESNRLQVRVELQADCFAGLWVKQAQDMRGLFERGDVEEALGAAAAVGDDRLQKQARGYVTPDSFTHGSSVQRMRWFKRGVDSGRLDTCNTFEATQL